MLTYRYVISEKRQIVRIFDPWAGARPWPLQHVDIGYVPLSIL